MAIGSNLGLFTPSTQGASMSSDTAEPPSGVQQTTGLLNTVAWVAGAGLLVYLLWPVFSYVRTSYRSKHSGDSGEADYESFHGSRGRRSRYADTEESTPRSRRRVSVQFEE